MEKIDMMNHTKEPWVAEKTLLWWHILAHMIEMSRGMV